MPCSVPQLPAGPEEPWSCWICSSILRSLPRLLLGRLLSMHLCLTSSYKESSQAGLGSTQLLYISTSSTSQLHPQNPVPKQSHLFRCQGFGLNPVGGAHAKQCGLEGVTLLKRVDQKRTNMAFLCLREVGVQTVKLLETESHVDLRTWGVDVGECF